MSFPSTGAVAVRPVDGGHRQLRIDLTPREIAALVVALQVALVATVRLDAYGLGLPVLRALLGVVSLAVVPGALLLGVVGVSPASRATFAVYAVGASAALLMAYGLVVNFGLNAVHVTPIAPSTTTLATSLLAVGLAWGYARRRDDPVGLSLDLDAAFSPLWLALALLPFLGVYGGLALTVYDSNLLLLVLYAAIAAVPLLVLAGRIPARALPVVVWLVAIALLLQNTLSGNYLAWGDQPKEASLALFVLRNGFWDPTAPAPFGNKYAMLRIVLLHPIYRVVTGLELVWVFKLVHPLIFSVTPVALLQAYRQYVDDHAAFLSVYLYVALFSFFVVLSRNTRTATALLFLALLALLVADRSLDPTRRRFLAIAFALSIVVSHYGVSYIVLAALPGVVVLTGVFDYVYGDNTRRHTSVTFVALYLLGTFAWYMYVARGGKTFDSLVTFVDHFLTTLQSEFLSPSTSATTRILANDWGSTTLRVLKFYNVGIGAVIGLGVLAVVVRRYLGRDEVGFDNEALAYAVVFLGVFGLTFLPVERFNTARTYPTVLLFFAPFFVVGVREVVRVGGRIVDGIAARRTAHRLAAVALVVFFLLNVGFVSATITHEYSTNVLPEKERVMDDGHAKEKAYFYKQYPTVYESRATEWLRVHAPWGATVYTGGWPGGAGMPFGYERQSPDAELTDLERRPIRRDAPVGGGYVFLSPFEYVGNVVKFPGGHFTFDWAPRNEVESKWADKHKVYDNGGSAVYR